MKWRNSHTITQRIRRSTPAFTSNELIGVPTGPAQQAHRSSSSKVFLALMYCERLARLSNVSSTWAHFCGSGAAGRQQLLKWGKECLECKAQPSSCN